MMGILQIVIAIATILIIVLVLARLAIRSKYFAFHRLFEQGYILTSPGLKAVWFESYTEADGYRQRARERGIEYDIYRVHNGEIVILPF